MAWREAARATRAATLLVHHTKKYAGGMAGDADASRGGGSMIGVARVVSTLFSMSESEAEANGISPEERDYYLRYDDAKANMTLITKKARWFKRQSFQMPARGFEETDTVGVLVPWAPPRMMDGITDAMIKDCLDVIARGVVDENGRPTDEKYGATKKSKGFWVGIEVQRILAVNEARAKNIVDSWIENGLLVLTSYKDQRKRERKGIVVDNSKRPGTSPTETM